MPRPFEPIRTTTEAVYAVRARTQGEALAHRLTRGAFLLGHVIPDHRTRTLFASWAESTGIDPVMEEMAALLDAAAERAGLAHRSALRQQIHAIHLVPILGRLQQLEGEYEDFLMRTRDERARVAVGWVVTELFSRTVAEDVPIRGWLASDLMTTFRWEVAARINGERMRLLVPRSPTLTDVPKGQRPKGDGAHLARNAGWYYRAAVAVPRATEAALAREHREVQAAAGVFLAPKEYRNIDERVDTKLVRRGIADAKRLLELPVPPEDWLTYFAKLA